MAQPTQSQVMSKQPCVRKWLIVLVVSVVALDVVVYSNIWFRTTARQAAPSASEARLTVGQSIRSEPTKNVFRDLARKAGARTCSDAVATLGEVVANGSSFSPRATSNRNDPDRHAVQMEVGQAYNDAKAFVASVVFAVPLNGQCESQAVKVAPVAQTCTQVAVSMQGATGTQYLSGIAVRELPTGRVMLVPAPNDTCVLVSTIYDGG